MRIIFIIFLILLNNCSFDNKSGIWKSESGSFQKDDRTFKDFKKIQSSNKPYNEIKKLDSNFNFLVEKSFKTKKWNDIYYESSNNFKNFSYFDQGEQVFKSKKLSKFDHYKQILFMIINNKAHNLYLSNKLNYNDIIDYVMSEIQKHPKPKELNTIDSILKFVSKVNNYYKTNV